MTKYPLLLLLCLCFQYLTAQQSTFVDEKGVFRWSDSNEEIRLFGVNYNLPFAHGYRAINYVGKDHKSAIDKDVYHMVRLGITAYRVHVWDTEITDEAGNLLSTHHLDLFDYLFAKLKARGIKVIVTPFKVGGNGYPEKDVPTRGFSDTLSKVETYGDKQVIKKQQRYFTQLLNHTNPYTNITYKNDPDIVALEINNEPTHDNKEVITAYVNTMVNTIRDAGFKNPILYNVSERSAFVEDYLKADIQGCTFQWYPTGLVHNSQLKGNFLPHVDRYNIPFDTLQNFQNKARFIYEFDSGDTNLSTIFPAMARSFREAKFQFATQFAYDALDLAFANTEYQTHYLNLIYTPSKAISLKIASEAFQEIDHGESFGRNPNNTKFRNTTLIPEKDLAVYNSDEKFFYTNSTEIKPKSTRKLEEIAGVRDSPVIQYNGNGAYFLDKIQKGIWRLEIMPDVLWVNDPFEKASLDKTVAIAKVHNNNISINLKDLGDEFQIKGINEGNHFRAKTKTAEFKIKPGTYLLHKNPLDENFQFSQKINNIRLNEYVNFNHDISKTYVVHTPKTYIEKGGDLDLTAEIISNHPIDKVEVVLPSGYQTTDNYELKKTSIFNYQTSIPKAKLYGNRFRYNIVVYTSKDTISFPNHVQGSPADWNFVSHAQYETQLLAPATEAIIFDAAQFDFKNMLWPNWQTGVRYNISKQLFKDSSNNSLMISTETLDAKIPDLTFKLFIGDIIELEKDNLENFSKIILKGSSGDKLTQKVQVALQLSNAQVFGKILEVEPEFQEIEINFEELQPVPMVLLPNAYPVFQHYWFQSESQEQFDASKIEAIQISIGPGIDKSERNEEQLLFIENILLE